MSDQKLQDRHVIVTGAAKGMGRGIATSCATAGADVTIFDVDTESAPETVERVEDAGSTANVVELDVSDPTAHEAALDQAVEALGPVHGLVNNAGVQDVVPIMDATPEDWDYHMSVNAKGPFFLSKHVASHMVEKGIEGGIVTIASSAEDVTYEGQGPYRASKRAVKGFSTVLAKEVADHGIRVNTINPGPVDTPMMQSWLDEHVEQGDGTREELLEMVLGDQLIERMGTGEEVGNVVTLLLSDDGEWITGTSIAVDGGQTVLP